MYGSYINKNWRKRHKNMHLFSFWAANKPAKWLVIAAIAIFLEKKMKQFAIEYIDDFGPIIIVILFTLPAFNR